MSDTKNPANHDEALRNIILTITKKWVDSKVVSSPCDISSGLCGDFAEEVENQARAVQLKNVLVRWSDEWWIIPDANDSKDCAFIADIVKLRAENAPLPDHIEDQALSRIIGAMTHAWIEFGGKAYDAEAPQGVAHFLDLPFYQRAFEKP